jgi:hypothetical protein
MIIHIKQLLGKSLKQAGIKHRVDTALVLEKAQRVLVEVVGEGVAKKVKPLYVRHKTMNLACLSSVVAQEIKLHENQIIEKINQGFDRELVERLSFTT